MGRRWTDDLLATGVQVVLVPQGVDQLIAQPLDETGGEDAGAVDADEGMAQIPGPLGDGGHEAGAQVATPLLLIHTQGVDVQAAGHIEPPADIRGGLHGAEQMEYVAPLAAGMLPGLLGQVLRLVDILGSRHHGTHYSAIQ